MRTYYRYLVGDCPMPRTFKQNVLFTLLMAIGMGICMVTIVAFITQMTFQSYFFMLTHIVPGMIFIGASIRLFICNHPIEAIIKRYLVPRVHGFLLAVSIVLVNVAFMATIMCLLGTLVGGIFSNASWDGFMGLENAFFGILPLIYLSAIPISFLLVGPAVKMLFRKLMSL